MANGKFSKPRNKFTPEPEAPRSRTAYTPPVRPVSQERAVPSEPEIPSISQEIREIREDIAIENAFLEVSEPEDDADRDLPPFLENLLRFAGQNRKVVLVSACAVALILLLSIIGILFFGSSSDPYEGRILNNVTAAGINLGGMTRSEAESALRAVTDDTFTETDMVITLPDTTLRLSPRDTKAKLDVKAVVKAAYSYGRTGSQAQQKEDYESSFTGNHIIGLLPYLELDEEYIWSVLNEYGSQFSSLYTETKYEVQGERPPLETDKYDPSNPCQTLVITMGTPGLGVDLESLYDSILDAYSFNQFQVTGKGPDEGSTPGELDLQAIYDALYIAPVDATVDSETFEAIPGSYGYGFDLEKAKLLLAAAGYGEVIQIPLMYIDPEVTEDSVLFRDVLGECQTPHSDNEKRTHNLALACATLNGLVLDPGDTFSYNEALGQRTEEKGYLPAPAYSGVTLVDSVGGGICQVSSTLYYCTLLSDLEILFRVNHGFSVSYIDPGMDATVNWGGPDFEFRNNTNYPIKIQAEVSDGYVKMRILGTDEKDYYVKMEYEITGYINPDTVYEEHGPDEGYWDGQVLSAGLTGSYVKTYRCKYDKETDKLLSRDFEARSTYNVKHIIIVRITGEETEPPTEETQPSEEPSAPTEGTTPPETTPPTEAPAPTDSPEPPATEAPAPPATEAPAPPATEAPAPPPTQPAAPADPPPAPAPDSGSTAEG